MSHLSRPANHLSEHQKAARRALFKPAAQDLVRVGSRRWFLQTGCAGIAGLSLSSLLRSRALGAENTSSHKSVILCWLSGGPSHLDFWDPKPEAPAEIRGPFAAISTKVPGLQFGEHLPLLASIADRLAVIRSVDCSSSDDHRAAVMQTGNSLALKDLKLTPAGILKGRYPSIGSLAARFRGPNDKDLPAFVGLGDPAPSLWHSDIWNAGELGAAYEPIAETGIVGQLKMPSGVTVDRLQNRDALRQQFDRLRHDLDTNHAMERLDVYDRQALDMVLSGKAEQAFQLDREPDSLRDAYGRDSFGEKTLLARRLVEAGVTFVVVSGRFGVFDNHGDDVVWGGLIKGLKPLFPSVDRSLYALITDLQSRGLLESTLIIVMGEFGRSPMISKTGGRTHWTNCMSVLVAGGAARGQVIGSTDENGYDIRDRRVIPADLAATMYRHLEIDLSHQWTDQQGRPHPLVSDGGRPIVELS
jgi:Protein of unknown function (DUF1501)